MFSSQHSLVCNPMIYTAKNTITYDESSRSVILQYTHKLLNIWTEQETIFTNIQEARHTYHVLSCPYHHQGSSQTKVTDKQVCMYSPYFPNRKVHYLLALSSWITIVYVFMDSFEEELKNGQNAIDPPSSYLCFYVSICLCFDPRCAGFI